MEKYSIHELKKIHYQSSRWGGSQGQARISVCYHVLRKDKAIGRNDVNFNARALKDMDITNKDTVQVNAGNFPEKKIQIIFNPTGLGTPSKTVNIKKNGGITFGLGGLIEQFAKENGFLLNEKLNYFKADLDFELSYQEGKMKGFELTLNKNTVEHIYRD